MTDTDTTKKGDTDRVKSEAVEDMEEDDDDPIEEEELNDYREMVENLGTFPDKVKINSLTMVAEDHVDSYKNANALYSVIREPLVSKAVSGERKLPLVYVVDSILKNAKGKFIAVIEKDASNWLPIVYDALSEDKRAKLRKVYNLWKDVGVFSESSWKKMGAVFSEAPTDGPGQEGRSKLEAAGVSWGKDGGLILMPNLRDAMQTILNEVQSDVENELDKVSLERLASIDADLLIKIKRTAEDSLRNGGPGVANTTASKNTPAKEDVLSFLAETRTPEAMGRSQAWREQKLDHLKDAHDMIASLRHMVIEMSNSDQTYTRAEAMNMTNALGAAGAMGDVLTNTLEKLRDAQQTSKSKSLSGIAANDNSSARGYVSVDKSLFTSDGIKKKNMGVVGFLYEVGLPFVSSADGRRFATQLELSNHLDALFKKGQLEKTMARTEERGWYVSDSVWSGDSTAEEEGKTAMETSEAAGPVSNEEEADPSTFTMPADESRDRCVVCGINFKMFFDNDDGIYKYNNCRETDVLNDEAAARETDQVLVHVTCWRALGSPELLSADQTLQEAMSSF